MHNLCLLDSYFYRLEADARAPTSAHNQRGESPLQVYALRPEADCNCVTARWGGKQQKATDQSVGNELDTALCTNEPASEW
jgi:hypothetical protein